MCGKKGQMYNVEIEGARIVACESCAGHGKKINKIIVQEPKKEKPKREQAIQEKEEEPVIIVVENYNVLIKNKREKLGLKQEELAKAINEKESLIQQIETKKIEPDTKTAEKLEKKLNIKLLELYKPPVITKNNSKEKEPVTLGDMIQIKTRKRK